MDNQTNHDGGALVVNICAAAALIVGIGSAALAQNIHAAPQVEQDHTTQPEACASLFRHTDTASPSQTQVDADSELAAKGIRDPGDRNAPHGRDRTLSRNAQQPTPPPAGPA